MATPAMYHHRAKVGALSRAVRNGERPQADLDDARRDLIAAKTADYIAKVLAQRPPLSDEQRTRLAELLKPVRRRDTSSTGRGGAT